MAQTHCFDSYLKSLSAGAGRQDFDPDTAQWTEWGGGVEARATKAGQQS